MSKQDTQFKNVFSLVIGTLVAVTIVLFALARVVGNATQVEHVKVEKMQQAAVDERTRPFVQTAVAGQDNSALDAAEAQAPAPGAAPSAAAGPQSGEDVYNTACMACHAAGIAGAPKFGDKDAWAPRIAKGTAVLHQHAIEGFQGSTGIMPPKGGWTNLSDDAVKAGVDYMVNASR